MRVLDQSKCAGDLLASTFEDDWQKLPRLAGADDSIEVRRGARGYPSNGDDDVIAFEPGIVHRRAERHCAGDARSALRVLDPEVAGETLARRTGGAA